MFQLLILLLTITSAGAAYFAVRLVLDDLSRRKLEQELKSNREQILSTEVSKKGEQPDPFIDLCNNIYDLGVLNFSDFENSISNLNKEKVLTPQFVEAMHQTGSAHKIIYYLGNNIDRATDFKNMDVETMRREASSILQYLNRQERENSYFFMPRPIFIAFAVFLLFIIYLVFSYPKEISVHHSDMLAPGYQAVRVAPPWIWFARAAWPRWARRSQPAVAGPSNGLTRGWPEGFGVNRGGCPRYRSLAGSDHWPGS